jgi:SAM-dependent methyltransferase
MQRSEGVPRRAPLPQAPAQAPIRYLHALAEAAPFADGAFDLVNYNFVIHECPQVGCCCSRSPAQLQQRREALAARFRQALVAPRTRTSQHERLHPLQPAVSVWARLRAPPVLSRSSFMLMPLAAWPCRQSLRQSLRLLIPLLPLSVSGSVRFCVVLSSLSRQAAIASFVAESRRLLRPNGVLAFVDNNPKCGPDMIHVYRSPLHAANSFGWRTSKAVPSAVSDTRSY